MKTLISALLFCVSIFAQTVTPPSGGAGGSGASPAGSAITDAQCWGSVSTLGVCISPIYSGTVKAAAFSTGGTPPALTPGTGGPIALAEGTAPSVGPATGVDVIYADSTQHKILASFNNGSYFQFPQVIASGSTALDFASTATGACATVITATATGAASTDVILFNANASIKAVTGYVPASTGGFSISAYPTTNAVNFEACNWTSGTVDPGSITVNWAVIR